MKPLAVAAIIGAALLMANYVPTVVAAHSLTVNFRTVSNPKIDWPDFKFDAQIEIRNDSAFELKLDFIAVDIEGIGQESLTRDRFPELLTIKANAQIKRLNIPLKINIMNVLAKFVPGLIPGIIEAITTKDWRHVADDLPDLKINISVGVPKVPVPIKIQKVIQLSKMLPPAKKQTAA